MMIWCSLIPLGEYLSDEGIFELVMVTASVFTITTMVSCIISKKSDSKIKIASSIAAISVIVLTILGSLVIDLKPHAVLVAVHLGIGILSISMVLLTTLLAFRMSRNPPVV